MRYEIYSPRNQYLSETLRQARIDAGMTQAQLAKATGRTQAYISKFERGQLRLDVVDFIAFTDALDLDPAALIEEVAKFPVEGRVVERYQPPYEPPDKPHDPGITGKEFLKWFKVQIESGNWPPGHAAIEAERKRRAKKKKGD